MELFSPDGHLTDAGLRAAISGGLNELERLEVAEHLSFCNACLLRYSALLEADALMQPEPPLRVGVMRRIRSRARRVLLGRYGAVAAALVLALGLYFAGAAAMAAAPPAAEQPIQPARPEAAASQPGLSAYLDKAFGAAAQGVNNFFAQLLPEEAEPQPPAPERQRPQKPEEKQNQNAAASSGSDEE